MTPGQLENVLQLIGYLNAQNLIVSGTDDMEFEVRDGNGLIAVLAWDPETTDYTVTQAGGA